LWELVSMNWRPKSQHWISWIDVVAEMISARRFTSNLSLEELGDRITEP
jgi:hypothetical protein